MIAFENEKALKSAVRALTSLRQLCNEETATELAFRFGTIMHDEGVALADGFMALATTVEQCLTAVPRGHSKIITAAFCMLLMEAERKRQGGLCEDEDEDAEDNIGETVGQA